MALAIITADQRIRSAAVKGLIFGQAGVGKTTLLKTLPTDSTLCLDFEAGMLSVQNDDQFGPAWRGDSIRVETWPEAKAILEGFQKPEAAPFLAKYKTVFIDSLTFASKLCIEWCKQQPQAYTKERNLDIWAVYRLLSEEMIGWTQGWKHLPGVNVWMLGGLERKKIDAVTEWIPLLDGHKLYAELPYIMDYCFVMARFRAADGNTYTGIFTDPVANPEYAHVPVKYRSKLDAIEQPHLGQITAKALTFANKSAPPPSTVPPGFGGDATSTLNNPESEAA